MFLPCLLHNQNISSITVKKKKQKKNNKKTAEVALKKEQ